MFTTRNSNIAYSVISCDESAIVVYFRQPNSSLSLDPIGHRFNGKRRVVGSKATTSTCDNNSVHRQINLQQELIKLQTIDIEDMPQEQKLGSHICIFVVMVTVS